MNTLTDLSILELLETQFYFIFLLKKNKKINNT